ncbi:MAG TPA: ABC transporter permease subunit [Chthoniobacterales bacterium]
MNTHDAAQVPGQAAGSKGLLSTWPGTTVIFLVLWQCASFFAGRNHSGAHTVPSLPDILGSVKLFANYWPGGWGIPATSTGNEPSWWGALLGFVLNSGLTTLRTLAGLALGVFASAGLAVAVSWSTLLRKMMLFPAHLARMLPLLALVPLFDLWFGNSEGGAVLFVGFVTFCVTFATTLGAIGAVPSYYEQYARSLGATPLYTYFAVILPAALPRINNGVVLALGFAWGGVIAAEFLGLPYGLGRIVLLAEQFNQFSLLALVAFIVVAYAMVSNFLLSKLLNRITGWS